MVDKQGVINIKEKSNDFVTVYKEMADAIGVDNMKKLYERFKGRQVTMPQRLYTPEYVTRYVREHYSGKNLKDLAGKFGYTERRIREFLKTEDENENEKEQ